MTEKTARLVAVAAAIVALTTLARSGSADSPSPSLPTSCSSGELVVSTGSDRFDCVPLRDALTLGGCSTGDFVTVGSSGRLECSRPSRTPWGIEGLLPDCSSGHTLVSEGFGRWKCVEPPR